MSKMSNIIYSKKLSSAGCYKKFFSIPVRPIKVLMSFSNKPEINLFERAIISLLMHKYYSLQDLVEILKLRKELIELIVNNLEKKEYLNSKKVTQKGEDAIKNIYKTYKDEVCYVFYDLNRKCILNKFCNPKDIIVTQGSSDSFQLENDAFKEEIIYKQIKINQSNFKYNEKDVENAIKRDIFNFKNNESKIEYDQELINVKILEIDNSNYNLISYVETDSNVKESKWSVINPISLEQDVTLYDYFYKNTNNESIKNLILDVMEFRKNSFIKSPEENKLYDTIKNNLFNKKIKDIHKIFIIPLMSVIKVINNTNDSSYDEKITRINAIKEAMTELGDLFEKLLYQVSMEQDDYIKMNYRNILTKNKYDNKLKLIEIAKQIGFDLSEDGAKLLYVESKSIGKIIAKPNQATLQECISWNLTISMINNNFYLSKIAKKYPDFINLLYKFKREYRDKNKHTTEIELISPKIYIELMWDIFEYAFDYKLDKDTLSKILITKDTIYDYSYAYEYIRTRLGNKIFDSSNKILSQIKISLIGMYNAYLTGKCSYIQEAYKLVDESLCILANAIKNNYNCKHKSLDDLYLDSKKIVENLKEKGINTETYSEFGNNLADSIDFVGQEQNVLNGFKTAFKNSVLRIKVLAIISMLSTNDKIFEIFKKYKDLFIVTSTVSFIQRHQQSHTFVKKEATVIVEEVIKLIDFIINQTNIIKFR